MYKPPFSGDDRLQNDVAQLKSGMNTKTDRWEVQRMIEEAIDKL